MKKLLVNLTGNLMDKEWLCTNGIGGYASSTVSGANTRRYHGLLVASLNPPGERRVILSRIEEVVTTSNGVHELGSSKYLDGTINPKGYEYLQSFQSGPAINFVYGGPGFKLEKNIFMPYGYNATVVEYANGGKESINLSVRPFLVYRDYHSLQHETDHSNFFTKVISQNRLEIQTPHDSGKLIMDFSKGEFSVAKNWYKNHFYKTEQERGFDFLEDSLSLGVLNFELLPGEKVSCIYTTNEDVLTLSPKTHYEELIKRSVALKKEFSHTKFLADLVESSDKFIVSRQTTGGLTLLAGYHWFLDWGRDTLISLRGLGIATGKQELCKSIIQTFIKYLDKGMLPNRFPDEGEEPEYNSVDASLWLFVVLYEYYLKFDDKEFVKENFDALTSIIKNYSDGTRYSIHLTKEGFIYAGEGNVQLTWMDARVNERPITPRHGCPVEINALWYNSLNIYQVFKNKLGTKGVTVKTLINKFEKNFAKFFYNEDGYLNDVVIPGEIADNSIRPNQIYALSLPFNLLNDSQKHSVFETVKDHLYTPLGLRSLSPTDPFFIPVYNGSPQERDAAYHQGTVWTFLISEYYTAELLLNNYSKQIKKEINTNLKSLQEHFYKHGGINCMAEIFDGLEPMEGKGTLHQAWSVAAVIDVLLKLNSNSESN